MYRYGVDLDVDYVERNLESMALDTKYVTRRDTMHLFLETALNKGCRTIDTAQRYRNEKNIGIVLPELLAKTNLTRDDIFILSKVGRKSMGFGLTLNSIEKTLNDLNTSYVDLMMIQHPTKNRRPSKHPTNKRYRQETWGALEIGIETLQIRSIGVANFDVNELKELLTYCLIKPAVVQLELFSKSWSKQIVDLCRQNNIKVQVCITDNQRHNVLLRNRVLKQVAKELNKTPMQLVLCWIYSQGMYAVPEITNHHEIALYMRAENIVLTHDQSERLTYALLPKLWGN